MITINYWAVIVAAIVQIALGMLWYGPLFGKRWMMYMNITPDPAKSGMSKKTYALMIIGSIVMAWVLAHAVIYASATLAMTGLILGILVGFMNWLGFIAPVLLASVLYEGRSWKLWWLNNGYYLVGLILMGSILALWR